jgi:hypothetical protein
MAAKLRILFEGQLNTIKFTAFIVKLFILGLIGKSKIAD